MDYDTDADSTVEHVHDVSIISEEQRRQLAAHFETTGVPRRLELYEDNTTKTNSLVPSKTKVIM